MKNLRSLFRKFVVIGFMLVLSLGFFCVQPTLSAKAAIFMPVTLSDSSNSFSMQVAANARRGNTLPLNIQTKQTVGGEIQYYCFNWKDLNSLVFTFKADIESQTKSYKAYRFTVAHIATEDLTQSIGVTDSKEPLSSDTIANNTFTQFNFQFFIDSNAQDKTAANSSNGYDFGIYKFDFSFDYTDPDNTDSDAVITKSVGPLYIAILPDDINAAIVNAKKKDVKLLYSVSSSKKLMNVFNLRLSDDTFKYVNPDYLTWQAYGTDIDNVNYCLDPKMQEDRSYASHETLYDAIQKTTGTTFTFNSQDIEGTWTVILSVKNTSGTEGYRKEISGLSTIKTEAPSYLWLIWLIVAIVVVIAIVIILLVILKNKKHDKVW